MLRVSFHPVQQPPASEARWLGQALAPDVYGEGQEEATGGNGAGLEGQGIVTFVVMSLLARWGQQDQLFWKRKIR